MSGRKNTSSSVNMNTEHNTKNINSIKTTHHHFTSKCGRRPTNEDEEVIFQNLSIDGHVINSRFAPVDIYVVCDGHGGDSVAKYCAPRLRDELSSRNLIYPLSKQTVNNIYTLIQSELINHPRRIGQNCGCTALVVVIFFGEDKEKYAQFINIGDSRSVISRNGLAVPMTYDHKPSWPHEKIRIDAVNKKYNLNKRIEFDQGDYRIGDLSVSRSFGDIYNTPHVTHIPDIKVCKLSPEIEFITMGCDGVWDVLRNEEVINFVADHRDNNHIDFYDIDELYPPPPNKNLILEKNNMAEKLAVYAIARGSTDNVSVIIIFPHDK